MEEEIPKLPEFNSRTRVFLRGDPQYLANSYQYATSSHVGMSPSAVIYPTNISDIIKAINYARTHNIGIAVRTGGHQYSGQSSTSGRNIQIDMSDTFQDDFSYEPEHNLLRTGTSCSLLEFNNFLGSMNMFVPSGMCSHVHLGGHVQTGGFGMMRRSFGLMCDHVEAFEIVLADGTLQKIWKPERYVLTIHTYLYV